MYTHDVCAFGMRVLALDDIHPFGVYTFVPGCIHTDWKKKLVTRKENELYVVVEGVSSPGAQS